MVETNAVFSRDSIRPVFAGGIPEGIKSLIDPHIKNHEIIYKAAISCNRELVYEAFENDPQFVGKNCSSEDIKKLADDMIDNTKKYLPKGWEWKRI